MNSEIKKELDALIEQIRAYDKVPNGYKLFCDYINNMAQILSTAQNAEEGIKKLEALANKIDKGV